MVILQVVEVTLRKFNIARLKVGNPKRTLFLTIIFQELMLNFGGVMVLLGSWWFNYRFGRNPP